MNAEDIKGIETGPLPAKQPSPDLEHSESQDIPIPSSVENMIATLLKPLTVDEFEIPKENMSEELAHLNELTAALQADSTNSSNENTETLTTGGLEETAQDEAEEERLAAEFIESKHMLTEMMNMFDTGDTE